MTDLSAIGNVRLRDVHVAVSRTLRSGLDAGVLREFLDDIDWGEVTDTHSRLATVLLNLLNWTTMFEEGELSADQYARKLLDVLPPSEVARLGRRAETPDLVTGPL